MITEEAIDWFNNKENDIKRRNLAIAKFLGWYQKLRDFNIWYIKTEDGGETMIWTPLYAPHLPHNDLPFFHDMNQLMRVVEMLRNTFDSSCNHTYHQEGVLYMKVLLIQLDSFACALSRNENGKWGQAEYIEYIVGRDCGSWREGLYMFISDIILTTLNL